MKQFSVILSVASLLVLGACGGDDASSGACSGSPLVGAWKTGDASETLTFTGSCAGTSLYCAGTFTYPNVSEGSGNVLVKMTSTNGNSGCLPLGETSCGYAISGTTMAFDCGAGAESYTKQ